MRRGNIAEENLNDHGMKNRVNIIGDCSKIPVGTAIIVIVAEVKQARVSTSDPTVNI